MAHYATGALGSLVPKLYKLLKDEYSRLKGVEEDIRFLVKELEYMEASLAKVSDKPVEQLDQETKLWARDVREMSYQIEDKIDIFLVRVEGNNQGQASHLNIKRFIRKSLDSLAKIKTRHKLAGEIKDIKGQVKDLKERYDRYHIGNTDSTPTPLVDPRLEAMYKMVTELVGIDESRGELIAMLTEGDDMSKEKLKTISVVGIGGLGKTTLAKAVYDKLSADFQCCAFVPVGQNPNVVTVLNRIHYELRGHKCEMETADSIINSLQDFLKNKRYLIVIDDIWNNKDWEIIKLALVENNYGSRVVTTTRKFDIASKIGQVYKLKPLSDDNSKKLLCTRIFHCDSKCQDYRLDEVPAKILSKCCGVPLAINTMASLLAGKPTKEWSAVYSSIGFSNNSDNEDVENTTRILSFSFYDMPSHLRACLLYLGVYPEDTEIYKNDLIRMWIAEGIVQDEQGTGLFVVGERCFYELINRSMIQPAKSSLRSVSSCYLHDMVLALIRALCVEYNFLTISDNEQGRAKSNIVRRLSYQEKTIMEQDLKTERNMVCMRSFFAYSCQIDKIEPFSRFKALRVLSLENCSLIDFDLKFVGDLLHLRYLNLRGTNIGEVPEELGALKFLQILSVRTIKELPSCIGLLTQLVCLLAPAPADGAIGKLTFLEMLDIRAPDKSAQKKFLKDVSNLTELRSLTIDFEKQMDESTAAASLESACKLSKLIVLRILGYAKEPVCILEPEGLMLPPHLRSVWLGEIKFVSLPKCINSSQLLSLEELFLRVRSVDVWGMRTLGSLPELCYLRLETESNLLVVDGGYSYFRKLRKCMLETHGTIVFLPDRSGAPTMPSVEELDLTMHPCAMKSFCLGYGQDISFIKTVIGLHSFPTLELVEISPITYDNCITNTMAEEEVEKALQNAVSCGCIVYPWLISKRITSCNMDIIDDKVIRFCVPVAWFKRLGFDFNYSYLGTLPSLEKVIADISCECATPWEVREAMVWLKHCVDAHPNHPMLEMVLHYQGQQLDHYVATQDNENGGPATASFVTTAEKEAEKRQMLGKKLYPLVDQLEHEQAPKVTGMLLEMDETEVLHLLKSPDALKSKVAEAMEVLRSAKRLLPNLSLVQQLGENLYPLVDRLEHEQAAKVTGMLLEMDEIEVLHLLESPDALKAKVAETMEVLRQAQHLQQSNASPEQQLGNLSLNDGVPSPAE